MNKGIINEFEIIESLNEKTLPQLSPFLQNCMRQMYSNIRDTDVIHCSKCYVNAKPDIEIDINGYRKKYVSIKSGRSSYVHMEDIKSFILFLRENGVSTQTQATILKYIYKDGTMDGTGEKTYSYDEYLYINRDSINRANTELCDRVIVGKTLNRCMFYGNGISDKTVDFVLHGNSEYGLLLHREEIFEYVIKLRYQYIRSIHIGPLVLLSAGKEKKDKVMMNWHYMLEDFENIGYGHHKKKITSQ